MLPCRRRGHPRLPSRRTRDPGCRETPAPGAAGAHRDPAAVRTALGGRTEPRVSAASRTAHRAGHERRRDRADGPGHPLRDRHRAGAAVPLLLALAGAAPEPGTDRPGILQPARGTLRAPRPGHLHPAVQRRRLPATPGAHGPRDPALEPGRGDPADGRAGPGRPASLPLRGSARPAPDPRRLPPAGGVARGGRQRPDHGPRPAACAVAGRSPLCGNDRRRRANAACSPRR
jgi:hypothetical protein